MKIATIPIGDFLLQCARRTERSEGVGVGDFALSSRKAKVVDHKVCDGEDLVEGKIPLPRTNKKTPFGFFICVYIVPKLAPTSKTNDVARSTCAIRRGLGMIFPFAPLLSFGEIWAGNTKKPLGNLICLKFWCNIIVVTDKWTLHHNVNLLLIIC